MNKNDDNESFQKKINTVTGIAIITGAILVFLILAMIALRIYSKQNLPLTLENAHKGASKTSNMSSAEPTPTENLTKDKLEKFSSAEDFKQYLEESEKSSNSFFGGLGRGGAVMENQALSADSGSSAKSWGGAAAAPTSMPSLTATPDRVSETNVQVLGIDEPDVVKTNGQQIYYSQEQNFARPLMGIPERPVADTKVRAIYPPYPYPEYQGETKIINAFPPNNLKTASKIDKNGDLLYYKNTLIVFAENKHKIYGYDLSKPDDPQEKWNIEIKDKDELMGARLYKDKVYLVTRSFIQPDIPCPFEPYTVGGSPVKFNCEQVYHPDHNVPVDLTYNLLSFDAETGSVAKTASFVGSSSSSVLYMSDGAIYLTYDYPGNFVKLFSDFLGLNTDLVPSSMIDKIKKIQDYDLSDTAKMTELNDIIGHFTRSMSNDEMMRIQNELTNRVNKFYQEHGRELENTGIVKVRVPDLEVTAMGKVPGQALNQFSLDEYRGNLRIATTSNSNFGWIGGLISGNTSNSISDVYVLNSGLNKIGEALNLGKGERIYSVRFIGNSGYVVTYKQVDPFYVLDLADPGKPEVKGELKIPGFSSYLHPLDDDIILGVGQENGQVKITLFDVSDPENPQEMSTYRLDEYYSEVSNNHHAFLQDKAHNLFFMPGSKGGYVFSYQGNELKLAKAISESGVKRALYIDNFLYVIAENVIMVFDENSWDKVKELEL